MVQEYAAGEVAISTLHFLKAQNVRAPTCKKPGHQISAQTHGVDVPGGQLQFHRVVDRAAKVGKSMVGARNPGKLKGRPVGGPGALAR